ncbi:MAG: glycine--tRNA ligase [Planctomycetes bacterium]|nr:glycine--tRNA ligase [Planctomycetota bacterium]
MPDLDTIVNLCKRRGFVFPSSEIYGGLESCWDYGPLGAELKRNVKAAWWRSVVQERDDMVGLDAAILMNPRVWKASGHIDTFSDPLVECKKCHARARADHAPDMYRKALRECPKCRSTKVKDAVLHAPSADGAREQGADAKAAIRRLLAESYVECPKCKEHLPPRCPKCLDGEFMEPRQFNLMFKTFMGPVEEEAAVVYLRPETAQGILVNFANVLTSSRKKLPFGVAQIGKAFRNEVSPGNFTFRTREFEQMEIEYFVKPGTDEECHKRWLDDRLRWYTDLGMRRDNLRLRQQTADERAHYAKDCFDIEYQFPMGWSELEGIANRTDYDLKQHSKFCGKEQSYFDDETKTHYIPYVIEPSAGADRATLAFLIDAYHEEQVREEKRVVLKFHKALAPIKAAVLPLLKNRPEIVEVARDITRRLKRNFMAVYDDTAAIGKLYRRQDEIGTPYCVTVDVQSLEDKQATVRDRDTMEQVRVPIADIEAFLKEKLS